jgi:eukaryotic-like serine/threonine-protein kinase
VTNEEQPLATPTQGSCYRFENVEFDEPKNELRVSGQPVAMEPRPLRVLHELLQRANEVVTKEELFEAVWDGRPTVDHVLANAISKLRSAIGEAGSRRIVTVPRVGYRLDGPVQRIESLAPLTVLVLGQVVPGRESFVLESVLGAAARSEVWLARHTKLGHLKVFKFANTAESLRALKREYTLSRALRRELAAGEEQGFVAVADANFSQAPYFLELPYIGPDLLRWSQRSPKWAALSREDRLRLFIQVARNLALAHNVGILHKDIKPANLLVSETGDQVQWVLTDFGSGHAVDPDRIRQLGITAMGMTVSDVLDDGNSEGTPLYLAPELLTGHSPTVQSDIFSMGVLLFQVLVGDLKRPMSTGWQREVGDELLVEDITAATEGEPGRRLGSAGDLVQRLQALEQRSLQRRDLAAAAEKTVQLQLDLARQKVRRPWLVGLVVALSLGLTTAVALGHRTRVAQASALAEARNATLISEFLRRDVLLSADTSRLGNNRTDTMLQVLHRAAELASTRFEDAPQVEAAIARQLGEIYLRLGLPTRAQSQFKRALLRADQGGPNSEGNAERWMAQLGLAQALADNYKAKEGLAELQKVEAAAGALLLQPGTELAYVAARARAEVLTRLGQLEAANKAALALADASERWPLAGPDEKLAAQQTVAESWLLMGKPDAATAVLKTVEKTTAGSAAVAALTQARTHFVKGRVLATQEQWAPAKAELEKARDIALPAAGPKAQITGRIYFELANTTSMMGDGVGSRAALKGAAEAFEATYGADSGIVMSVISNLGLLQVLGGESDAGLENLNRARSYMVKNGNETAGLDYFRAVALNDVRKPSLAIEVLDGIDVAKYEAAFHVNNESGWKLQAERGRAMKALGQVAEGRALILKAVEEMRKVGMPKEILAHYTNIARVNATSQ